MAARAVLAETLARQAKRAVFTSLAAHTGSFCCHRHVNVGPHVNVVRCVNVRRRVNVVRDVNLGPHVNAVRHVNVVRERRHGPFRPRLRRGSQVFTSLAAEAGDLRCRAGRRHVNVVFARFGRFRVPGPVFGRCPQTPRPPALRQLVPCRDPATAAQTSPISLAAGASGCHGSTFGRVFWAAALQRACSRAVGAGDTRT